jgi:catechol 2,3-dioxygenase-like lactoylglutathione lyase family enzyme
MRLDHVVIPCFDADATLRFYGETLGLPLVHAHEGDDWGGFPWLMMIFSIGDGREIVLVALKGAATPANPLPADSRHYAFAVETLVELDAWRGRLRAAGLVWDEEDHGEQQSIYFPDPAGNVLEITAPPTTVTHAVNSDALAAARRWIAKAPQ